MPALTLGIVASSLQQEEAPPEPEGTPAVFRSIGAISSGSNICPKPAGVEVDDLLVLLAHSDDNTTGSCDGFIEVGHATYVGAGGNQRRDTVLVRFADGTEESTFTIAGLGGSYPETICLAYSGASGVEVFGALDNSRVYPGAAVTVDGSVELVAFSWDYASGSTAAPAGWNRRLDGAGSYNFWIADRTVETHGTTAAETFPAISSGEFGQFSIVVKGTPSDTPFVGYRTFDAGENDKVVVSAGESTGQTLDVYSQFALVRPLGAGGGRAYTWFTGERADLSRLCYWYLNWDGYQETDAQSGYTARGALTQVTVADGWILIGITKASGVNPTYHKCLMSSGAWAHESGGGGLPVVAPLGAGGHWYLGHDAVGGETWYGDIAVESFFDRALETAEVEMLFESLAHWTGLHPVHCWRLDQATITDLVGSADQTTLTGTVLATDFSPLPTTVIYTDDFNRADGNLGDGPNWDQMNAPISITSNHLDINGSGSACAYTAVGFPPTSHWAEGMMTIQDGQEGSLGPSVRQGGGENSYYSWLRGPANPPTFEIWRQWFGYTQIGGLSVPIPAAKTGPVRVAVEVDGLTIRGYVDGELMIEWVEDNPTAGPNGSYPGINGGMFGATNGLVQCDDFRCGPGRYPGPP